MAGEALTFTPWLHGGHASSMPERHSHPAGSQATTAEGHATQPDARVAPQASSSTIAVGRALGTVVVTVRGVLTEHDAPTLSAVLGDLIKNQGNLDVVVDMRRLSSASPSGLAALAAAGGWAVERGATFRLSGPARTLREKLTRVGLASTIELGVHQPRDAKS